MESELNTIIQNPAKPGRSKEETELAALKGKEAQAWPSPLIHYYVLLPATITA